MELGDVLEEKLEIPYIKAADMINTAQSAVSSLDDLKYFSKHILDISEIEPNLYWLLEILSINKCEDLEITGTSILVDILFNIASVAYQSDATEENILYEIDNLLIDNLFTYDCFGFNRIDSNPALYEEYKYTILDILGYFNIKLLSIFTRKYTYVYVGKKILDVEKGMLVINVITI